MIGKQQSEGAASGVPCVLDEPVAASDLGVAAVGRPWCGHWETVLASRNMELMAVHCPREQGCNDECGRRCGAIMMVVCVHPRLMVNGERLPRTLAPSLTLREDDDDALRILTPMVE